MRLHNCYCERVALTLAKFRQHRAGPEFFVPNSRYHVKMTPNEF
jgi:hypothetical protein